MKNPSFQLQRVKLDFGDQSPVYVDFLGPNANLKQTHISLIAGANGTSKSRLLAACIEKLCSIEANQEQDKYVRRDLNQSVFGLTCTGLSTLINGSGKLVPKGNADLAGDIGLPTRVLALSNLVMDKFHFPRDTQSDEPF